MSRLSVIGMTLVSSIALASCGGSADESRGQASVIDGVPYPAAGLWQMKMKVDGDGSTAPVSKVCYDVALAKEFGMAGPQMEGGSCQQSFSKIAGGFQMSATCTDASGQKTTSNAVIKGDLSKAYTVSVSQGSAGPPIKLEIEATRLGDCPADFKPGDMESRGVRVNIADAANARAKAQ